MIAWEEDGAAMAWQEDGGMTREEDGRLYSVRSRSMI